MAERAPQRVLVVDDTEGNRYATSRILRSAGFDVSEAATGRDALDKLRQHPDLVVLDVNLPDMTGFEVVERMRRIPEHAAIPVLHLSASYTTSADQTHGLEAGADAYLTHPIDPTVFVATTRALLRAGAADRQLHTAAREWQATFDAMTDAVFVLSTDLAVRRANRATYTLLGAEDHEVIGQPLATLLPATFGEAGAALAGRIAGGQRLDRANIRLGERTFSVNTEPVHLEDAGTHTVCVMEDVTARIAAEHEREELLVVAEQARFEAESANRAKSEFLAVMSHELRTPLNAIGGYAQLIELGIRGPVTEQQKADLDRIMRSQVYLLALINDVLNFAKIESGHLQLDLVDLPLDEVIAGMSDFVQPQLRERGLTYEVEGVPTGFRVIGDRDKVQQILLNLLSNALKFTPAGGRITVSCRAAGDGVVVSVSDTGHGIAPDKLEWIFEPFVQVDRRYKREQEGIGLGLAISRDLARAMKGDLAVRSEEGKGSTFELRLPKAM